METLRFCTAGSVDDGKSTLVGQLLHDIKSIFADQLAQVERTLADRGFDGLDLSLLVDGLRAEREQGITIDFIYQYFATDKRNFILADIPSHVQYTRNTVTGVSTSEVVVLLGVGTVILEVSKIDLVGYSEKEFKSTETEFLQAAAKLCLGQAQATPISVLQGDNVVAGSDNLPWYSGPTVLELLETIQVETEQQDFRFPIQYVIRATDYRGYAGQVAAGSIHPSGIVDILIGQTAIVGIDTPDGSVDAAYTGDTVMLRIADDIDLSRGYLLAVDRPTLVRSFAAHIVGLSEKPIQTWQIVKVHYDTQGVRGRTADPANLNDIVDATVELQTELPIDTYAVRGNVGPLLLADAHSGGTLEAGLVV